MKYSILVILLFSLVTQTVAQDIFGLEELKLKSNDFTEYVMSEGTTLNEKLPINLVPNRITDFKLEGQDSLAMIRIKSKFNEYYDYLLSFQNQKGITTKNLTLIFVESAKDSSNDLKCFKDWYATESHTIALTLACYQSELVTVRESCIARSIQATIINNAVVAECFKVLDKK
mgnify:FL=1